MTIHDTLAPHPVEKNEMSPRMLGRKVTRERNIIVHNIEHNHTAHRTSWVAGLPVGTGACGTGACGKRSLRPTHN